MVTDGNTTGSSTILEDNLQNAGDNLRALGVTVAVIAVDAYDQPPLEALASTALNGSPLLFHDDTLPTFTTDPATTHRMNFTNALLDYFCGIATPRGMNLTYSVY